MVQVGTKSLRQDTAETVLALTLGSLRYGSRLTSGNSGQSTVRFAADKVGQG
jgi:hypothetical protein